MKSFLKSEVICIFALLTTALIFSVFGAIDSLKFQQISVLQLAGVVFSYTVFFGFIPTVVVGAPLFHYLKTKDILSFQSASILGLILGVICVFLLRGELGYYGLLASVLTSVIAWFYQKILSKKAKSV